jgi:hypothetical protein
MNKNKIIILGGHGENDAINGLMRGCIPLFEKRGFKVFYYDLSDANWNKGQLIEILQSREVLLALTYLGFGQNLSLVAEEDSPPKNIWEFFNVPLLKWQGDIPAYLPDRHIAIPKNSVNIYPYEEFFNYWKNWIIPADYSLTRLIQPFALYGMPISTINKKQRMAGKLVFHKTGGNPSEKFEQWKQQFSPIICKLLKNMCESLTPKCMDGSTILAGNLVSDFLKDKGISERISPKLFHHLVSQLDDYSRRVKFNLITNSLLDFPVIIQGRSWDHIDFSNKKAVCLPAINYEKSTDAFLNQFGVIDISPNTSSLPHDRVYRAAGSYTLCITNKQTWFTNKFAGFEQLTYEFNKESIQETVNNVLKNPEESQDMAIAFGEHFRRVWTEEKSVEQLVEIAELASLNYAI